MPETITIFLGLLLAYPLMALLLNGIFYQKPSFGARYAGYCIGLGFCTAFGGLVYYMYSSYALDLVLANLVLLVSFIIHRFSLRYMDGDRLYHRFFLVLSLLTESTLIMVLSDRLWLFWAAWTISNGLLVLLMIHKKEWGASMYSGRIALCTLGFGSLSLLMAVVALNGGYDVLAATGIVVAALAQSGLFPFHRWLISSLNSPTPVSAFMHAGLVNGGGILIVKFYPLLIQHPLCLTVLFIFGALSALMGTFWKLMQNDIKKMLACSTMAQMGFMMMQCGVGLFPAAIAHLCWHGLFKAYLFLTSGSVLTQKKQAMVFERHYVLGLVFSLIGGALAMMAFAFITNKPLNVLNNSFFALFFAFIAGSQVMLSAWSSRPGIINLLASLVFALFSGVIYGSSIQLIQSLIPGVESYTLALSTLHLVIMVLFACLWLFFNLGFYHTWSTSAVFGRIYMVLLNASQPSKKAFTALRNQYRY